MTSMPELAIQAQQIRKNFGKVVALDGVDLSVPVGQIFGLLGPNGAGKTTMIRVLTTVLRADSGTATVMGRSVSREAPSVRGLIGLAGQYAALDPNLTGRENLRLVGSLTQISGRIAAQRSDELLERFSLSDAGNRLVRTYSGGMRRRLDLAAALVHRPPVIFLDEPTTGLDPESRVELWAVIKELVADGATILLTTQYMEEADRLADQLAVIDHGAVIAEGTPTELKRRLGSSVIELGFADDATATRAAELLAGTSTEEPHVTGRGVQIKSNEGTKLLTRLLRTLDQGGIEPETLTVHEPSLDDVFLSLTGKPTEDSAPPVEAAGKRGRGAR